MKRETKLLYVLIIALFLFWDINAQVTIGIGEEAIAGALLELKENSDGTSTKGLGMPCVSLTDLSNLYPMLSGSEPDYSTLKTTHTGLMVYNMNMQETADRICPGLHVWDGEKWEPLPSYPSSADRRTLVSDELHSFIFLDPNFATNWPADKDRSQYPLGYIGTFTDNRVGDTPQTYNYTRFYVGLAERTRTYEIEANYSCDRNNPVYGTPVPLPPETDIYFEDGVWMNDNLRATVIDPVRDNGDVVLTLTEGYNAGGSNTLAFWGYPNKASANKSTLGLIYTWAAATNGKEGAVSEEGLAEGLSIQGICPEGWHLPSDREWTNLENAIIKNTSIFSTTPTIGGAAIGYESANWRGEHGAAMKSTTAINGQATAGTSKTAVQGGFNGLLSGIASNESAITFGTSGCWWSGSIGADSTGWFRNLGYADVKVGRAATTRSYLFSVRCKKN